MPDLWADADVIHRYTRAQAVADGVLVDVTATAKEAGFVVPVALTRAVWADTVQWDHGGLQDEEGRLWDVLWMAYRAGRGRDASRVEYQVLRVPNRPDHDGRPQLVTLAAVCGPGDLAEPVVTIMLPGED